MGVDSTALIHSLLEGGEPVVQYKIWSKNLAQAPNPAALQAARKRIAGSPVAKRLLTHRQPDGTIDAHPYRKWQGPHWTLYCLAQIDYPPEEEMLLPLRLAGRERRLALHPTRHRRRTDPGAGRTVEALAVAGRRLELRQAASGSHFIGDRKSDPAARPGAGGGNVWGSRSSGCRGQGGGILSTRGLFRRLRDGQPIRQDFSTIQYPIQFYDVLFVLIVMAECGKLSDPRCQEALALLRSKQLPDGGFPLERRNAKTSDQLMTRGTYADWGPTGRRRMNPWITAEALGVLQKSPI